MYVKSAFLNGYLKEEAFYILRKVHKGKMFKLRKALYGLKQAPRVWNSWIYKYILKVSFTKCLYEHALYIKTINNNNLLLICLYVNDLIFTGNNPKIFKDFKLSIVNEFKLRDDGLMSYFIGIKVK